MRIAAIALVVLVVAAVALLRLNETSQRTPQGAGHVFAGESSQPVGSESSQPVARETSQATPREGSQANSFACGDRALFTHSPIDPDKILSVTPLGNLDPPDHTTPTDHIYVVTKNHNDVDPTAARAVVSPGDVTITTIMHRTAKKSGQTISDDYSIQFSACKDVNAKFGHVTKLSPVVAQALGEGSQNCQTSRPRPEDEYTSCRKELSLRVSAGETLGETGGGAPTGLDFVLIDMRTPPLAYANAARYRPDQLHITCPLDLFESAVKARLYDKLGGNKTRRSIEPRCGQVMQDIDGTAQGNWIIGAGLMDMPESWSRNLALVHDNFDPTLGQLVIGGTVASAKRIQFLPIHSGNVNREFGEVKPDGKVYCYSGVSIHTSNPSQNTRVLVQMADSRTLNVESQNGSCSGEFSFRSPTVYQR